ncbi:hypothetical protein [Oxalobacter aliiformigenes]|uniref:hypothetical protein n=1 Tax=Oxalobacter aliiformigenes TaxID=2946593 RepID=UPI002FCD94CD
MWPDFPAGPASHSGDGWISSTGANRRKPSVHPARKGLKAGATAERRHQGGKYGREIRDGRQQAHISFGHTGILGRRSETGSGRCPRQTECRAQAEMHRWLFREEIKRPQGQGGQQENERDAVLPRRHAMGDGTDVARMKAPAIASPGMSGRPAFWRLKNMANRTVRLGHK